MHQVLIREATVTDIPFIQDIYAYHVLNGVGTFEEIPPNLDEMTKRYTSIKQANYPFLVAVQNYKIVGYCYANMYRPRTAYRMTVEDSVFVAQDYIGHGIGCKLLAELIKCCKNNHYTQILAFIGDSNNHGSVRLHQSLGFKPTGVLKNVGYKFDQWVDVVIMQLDLSR